MALDLTEPIYVDNSRLAKLARCNLAAYLRYGLHWDRPMESPAPRAGTDCHLAFEVWAKGGTTQEAMTVWEQAYVPYAEEASIAEDNRLHPDNVRVCIEQWLDNNPILPGDLKTDPELVEVGLQFELLPRTDTSPAVIYYGRADAIAFDKWKRFWVVDFKTTGRISADWILKYKNSQQLLAYTRAAERSGMGECGGALIMALELSKVPRSTRRCKEHDSTYEVCGHLHVKHHAISVPFVTEYRLDCWERTAIVLAKQWVKILQDNDGDKDAPNIMAQGPYTDTCNWCEFSDFCLQDRKPELLERLYIKRPWEPFKTEGDYN